jgi:hypothetical protein
MFVLLGIEKWDNAARLGGISMIMVVQRSRQALSFRVSFYHEIVFTHQGDITERSEMSLSPTNHYLD